MTTAANCGCRPGTSLNIPACWVVLFDRQIRRGMFQQPVSQNGATNAVSQCADYAAKR